MKKLTKVLLTIMTLFMVMTTVTASEDVDVLKMYDTNNDGVIDADERLILDIDIEAGRVTVDESEMAAMFTSDDTVILNDEIQDFAMGDQTPVVESTVAPVVVSTVRPAAAPVVTAAPPEVAATVAPEPVETKAQRPITAIVVCIIMVIVIFALILKNGN